MAQRRFDGGADLGAEAAGQVGGAAASGPPPDWPDTLRRRRPDLSAALPMVRWQRLALAAGLAGVARGLAIDAVATVTSVMALVSPVFLCVLAFRAVGLRQIWRGSAPGETGALAGPAAAAATASPAGAAEDLPLYNILVPLFREEGVVADLVRALDRLDWPRDRREILFITEAGDGETRRALDREVAGRPDMRILTVPAGAPQTKPRALMYALGFVHGDFVVVYDAEDEPEPDQLRRAYARLSDPNRPAACVQAQLNVSNARENFITRQFALEYTALFDALLPALERWRLPVPLGGTSNHFRRDVLEAAGGWDPYNVTEDADLGIRLARAGWQVEVLPSTTWEEAPPFLRVWLGQRARWMKGWMQTALVHLRRPGVLWRDLGPRGFFGMLVLMGGMILSALLHPLVYAFAAWSLWSGHSHVWPPNETMAAAVWWFGALHVAAAYALGIALAVAAAIKRHDARLAAHAIFIPVYWMLISLAAYRALVDLVRRPFHWRKTAHFGRRGSS